MTDLNRCSHAILTRLVIFLSFVLCTRGQSAALWQSTDYERGRLGETPTVSYKSTSITSPLLNIKRWSPACDSDDLIFLSVHGKNHTTIPPRMYIIDQKGMLIWSGEVEGLVPNNLNVQQYKGKDYLTYWAGDERYGVGFGSYYMLDQTYATIHNIEAMNDLDGDLHAFTITDTNTALYTSYEKRQSKIMLHDAQSAYWLDPILQEQNFAQRRLIFEWHASDHFDFGDMATNNTWAWNDGWEEKPWDWLHINSATKDPRGNYLISGRFNGITYINGSSGEVLWNLGGKSNSFDDVSQSPGGATNFSCQHDASWADSNYNAITLFDNSAFYGKSGPKARGLKIGLDLENMTAWLIAAYQHPDDLQSESQGSHQVLPNGNSFIGYGFASAFSEFTADGEMLCDWQFGPMFTGEGGAFNLSGHVQSYRAYKRRWRGYPAHNPEAVFLEGRVFVSWNGATEVKHWSIAGGQPSVDGTASRWERSGIFAKTGFEANTTFEDGWPIYRLQALDSNAYILGQWTITRDGVIEKYLTSSGWAYQAKQRPNLVFAATALAAVLLIILALRNPRALKGLYHRVSEEHQRMRSKSLSAVP